MPDWYVDEPPCWPEDVFYMREFWRLSSERQLGGHTIGPIPYSRIEARATRLAIADDDNLVELFCLIVERMDRAFLAWQTKEHDRHASTRKPAGGAGASAKGSGVRRSSRSR